MWVKKMSLEHIQTLAMNPHFYAKLMQNFLSGYEKPCEVRLYFMALPILLYADSRKKLMNANSRSKIETLFNAPQELTDDVRISGRVRLSGYLNRFESLKEFSRKSLIILYSENKIIIKDNKIILMKIEKYSDYSDNMRNWFKAAHYLGVIFAKTNEDHLNYFLGVDRV